MQRLPLVRLIAGVLVALLGLVVAGYSYMNVGYYADLGETATRLGDDGTLGSLVSFVAGVLLVGLGALGAATSGLSASNAREAEVSQTA